MNGIKTKSGNEWARLRRTTGVALSIAQYKFNIYPGAGNWNAVIEAMSKFQEADNGLTAFYASIPDKTDRYNMRSYLEAISTGAV